MYKDHEHARDQIQLDLLTRHLVLSRFRANLLTRLYAPPHDHAVAIPSFENALLNTQTKVLVQMYRTWISQGMVLCEDMAQALVIQFPIEMKKCLVPQIRSWLLQKHHPSQEKL